MVWIMLGESVFNPQNPAKESATLKPCRYLWAVLPPKAKSGSEVLLQQGPILISMAHVTT